MLSSLNPFSLLRKNMDAHFGFENGNNIAKNKEVTPKVQEFVPKWQQVQEDLKYMFQIDVMDEEDVAKPEIKMQMYEKAVEELKKNSPFALDYFIEEKLLRASDIPQEDRGEIMRYAYDILSRMKNPSPLRKRTEELFIEETDILSPDDLVEIEKVRRERSI